MSRPLPGPPPQRFDNLDPGQLLLTGLTERIEKELQVRNDLINQIPAAGALGKKVRALLHCLVGFTHVRLGGEWHITVPLEELSDRLLKDHRTINTWVRWAYPYVEEIPSNHSAKTFVIHWLALVNREPLRDPPEPQQRQAGSTAVHSTSRQAGSTADQNRGGQIQSQRGSNPNSEGVKFVAGGGQIRPSDLPPFAPLKTGEPVLKRDVSKEPVKPVGDGGQFRLPEDLRPVAAKWRMAIASHDLNKAEDVEELYGIAVAHGIVPHSQVGREHIFTQACVDNRLMRESMYYVRNGERIRRTPGAVFRENTLHRRWTFRTDVDVDDAVALMAAADELVQCGNPDDERARVTKVLSKRFPR